MKSVAISCVAIVSLLALWRVGTPRAGVTEVTLLDAPRGSWLATCRPDAVTTVLEEREGWRRVRVEGWIQAAPGGSPPPAAPGAVGGQPAGAPAGDAVVRGVLQAEAGASSPQPGGGLVVLLISDLEALDREHAEAGLQCRSSAAEADRRVDDLKAELDRALNSSDNFRQAASRSDRLKKDLESAQKERRERLRRCRETALAIFDRHAVQRTISDATGLFEFADVPTGRYRVVAAERAEDDPRSWVLECRVARPGLMILDPVAARSPIMAFWGLR